MGSGSNDSGWDCCGGHFVQMLPESCRFGYGKTSYYDSPQTALDRMFERKYRVEKRVMVRAGLTWQGLEKKLASAGFFGSKKVTLKLAGNDRSV